MSENKTAFYIKTTDRVQALLAEIKNENVTACTFCLENAKQFETKEAADTFITDNNLSTQFEPIEI